MAGGKHMTVKAMKRTLKKHGLKVSGTRRALAIRMRKAHIQGGGLGSALGKATKTVGAAGKGVFETGVELAKTPGEIASAAFNSKKGGRRSRKGGRYY